MASGTCEEEWLPQIITLRTSLAETAKAVEFGSLAFEIFSAICPCALLWSRRVRQVMFFAGIDGAFRYRISALVLAGLATTKILTFLEACFSSAAACDW